MLGKQLGMAKGCWGTGWGNQWDIWWANLLGILYRRGGAVAKSDFASERQSERVKETASETVKETSSERWTRSGAVWAHLKATQSGTAWETGGE